MAGKLFIVATPIGNLEDITLRALNVLKEVDLILAEDSRVTKKLLMHYEIDKPILSYHQHSGQEKRLEILRNLLEGKNLALVTDAGTPGISDPGNELVSFLYQNGSPLSGNPLKVIPVPGPSALTAALSVCGFRANKFVFLGFLPKKKRKKVFDWLKEGKITFAFYESPKRILKSLDVLYDYFPEAEIFVARELTKMYESTYRGNIKEVKEKLQKDTIKGEIVVVVRL